MAKHDMSESILTMNAQANWEAWLEQHGATSPAVWLRIAKKGAAQPTLTYAEALESALCFGWIDGQKKSQDEHYWLQRFTPRTPKSIWSQVNKAKVETLIASGRMRAAGLLAIERAKEDGRWDAAYASASTAEVPGDLQQALDGNSEAKAFFAGLDSRNRYAILFRVHNCKKPETRAKRIAQFVDMLSKGETIHPKSGSNA
ncbi:YdeI/OmpD-associated family protein [Niveibacterium microcysteis]|uniref:YdeI/OmpD-associated family protein n=1 Tax=Niveibacterium microcysteis TaxID=2811415 RepID=A0ABX7M9W0_9RHOO|nr:YdeI/OmpD-associated family protein [Niveibacterium microcysteis]QSI78517.1 YdeI/OmpD-associated family protein [Niveibacterium microcysteis]